MILASMLQARRPDPMWLQRSGGRSWRRSGRSRRRRRRNGRAPQEEESEAKKSAARKPAAKKKARKAAPKPAAGSGTGADAGYGLVRGIGGIGAAADPPCSALRLQAARRACGGRNCLRLSQNANFSSIRRSIGGAETGRIAGRDRAVLKAELAGKDVARQLVEEMGLDRRIGEARDRHPQMDTRHARRCAIPNRCRSPSGCPPPRRARRSSATR